MILPRRYRLGADEVEPVMQLVRERLVELVEEREDLTGAQLLFRILFRHSLYEAHRPAYPDPLDWRVIENWLKANEGIHEEEFDDASIRG